MVHRSGSGCFSPATSPENANKMTLKGAESDCLTMANESDLLDQKSNKDAYYAVDSDESFIPVGQTHPNQNLTKDKTIEINFTNIAKDECNKQYEESTSSNTFLESLSLTHKQSKPYMKINSKSLESSGKPNNKNNINISVNNMGESCLPEESDNKKCNDDKNIVEFKNSVNSFKNTCVERKIVEDTDASEMNLRSNEHCAPNIVENQSIRLKEISLPCKLPLAKLTDILDQISPKKLNATSKTTDILASDAFLRNSYVDVRDCLSNNLKMCPLGNDKSDIKILVNNERIVNTNNDNLDSTSLKNKTVMLNSLEIRPRSLHATPLNSNTNLPSPTVKKSVSNRILCLYCDKTFATATLQNKHSEKVHLVASNRRSSGRNASTQNDLQCFQGCSFCPNGKGKSQIVAVTTDLSDLFKHLVSFHKESYFACGNCIVRFTSLDFLNTHMSEVHGEIVEALKLEDNKSDKVEIMLESQSPVPSSFKRCKNSKLKIKSLEIAASSTPTDTTDAPESEIDFEDNISVNIISNKADDSSEFVSKSAAKEAKLETKPTTSKVPLKMTRSQSSLQASNADEPMLSRLGVAQNRSPRTRKISKTRKTDLKVQSIDRKNKSKNEIQEFVINKNINSKNELFDSKFDVDFYQQVIVNVRDNLAHHLDGKLNGSRSNGRLSCPLSPPVKSNMAEITRDGEIHESNLSLKTISAFPTLLTFEQYGSNLSSGSASKITRKKATKNSWKWKWDFIKKYKYYNENGKIVKKIKPSNLGQRDLSKLDMWTQLSMRTKHDSMVRKAGKKSSYEVSEKNKKLRQLKSLNEILDMRLFPKLNLEQDAQDIKAGAKVKEETAVTTTEYSISDRETEMNKTRHISFEDSSSESDVQPLRISSRRKSVRIQSTTNSGSLNSSASNGKNLQLKTISMSDTIQNCTPSIPGDQTISSIPKTEQTTSTVESISENKDIPSCLNLIPRKAEEANSSQVDPILSGEWARPRCYICMCCGAKLLTSKHLEDHKTSQHPYIYSTHYEIVGNEMIDNELYKLFYLPGMNTGKYVSDLKKDRSTDLSVKCIKNIETRVKSESEVKSCTKCGKELSNSSELYRHILECAGDYTWLLAKKKCKYRPFGRRSRRKKTRLPNIQIPRRRPTNVKPIRRTIKKDNGPRSKPSDAETIQRMLSNLPAKRSSRHIPPIPRPRNRPVSKTRSLLPPTIRRTKNGEVTTQRITRNLIQNKQLTQNQQNLKNSSKKAAEDGTKIIRNVATSNKFKNKTVDLQKVTHGQVIKLGRRTIIKEDDTPTTEDLQTKQVTNKTKRILKTTRIISSKIIDTTKVGVRRKLTRGRIIKPILKEDDNDEEKDSKHIEANTDNVTVVTKKILKPSRKETITKSLVKRLSFRNKSDKSKSSTEKKLLEFPIADNNFDKIKTPVLTKINRKTRNVINKVARTLGNKKSKKNESIVENNTSNKLETTKNIDLIEKPVESVASGNKQTEKFVNTSRKAKLIKNKKKVKTIVKKANEKVESSVTNVCANIAQKDESIQKYFPKDEAIQNDKLLIDTEKNVDNTKSNTLPENTSRTAKRNTNAINKDKLIENVTSQSDAIFESKILNDDVISDNNTLHAEASVTNAFLTYVKSVKGNRKTKLNKRNISKELQNIADQMIVTKCKDIKQNGSNDLVTQTDDVKLIVELKPKTENEQLKYPVADIRNADIPSSDACNMTTSNEECISEIINGNIKDQAKTKAQIKSPKMSPKRKDIKTALVRKLSIRRTKKYDLQKQMEKDGKKEEVNTIKLIVESNPEVSIDIPIKIKESDKVVPKKKQSKLKSLKTVIDVLKGDKKKRVSPKNKNKTVILKPPILKIPVVDKIMSARALVNKIETIEDKKVKGNSITSDNDITNGNIDFRKVINSSENVVNHNVESIIRKREILNIPLFVKSGVNNSLTNSEQVAETNTTFVGHNIFQKNIDNNSIVSISVKEVEETNILDPVNLSSDTKLQEPLLNISKPVLKLPSIIKRPGKKLDDCIAMLTGKLQAKLSEKAKASSPVNSIFNSVDLSVSSHSSITNIFTDSNNIVSPAICSSDKLSEGKDQLTKKSEEKEVKIEKDNIWLNCHVDKSIQNTGVIQNDISLLAVDHIESVKENSKIFEVLTRKIPISQENNYPLMVNTEISIAEPLKRDSYEHGTIPTLLPYAETVIEDYMEKQSKKLEENNSFVDQIVLPIVNNSEQLREDSSMEITSDSDILRPSITDLKVANNDCQLQNILFEDISIDVDDMKQAIEQPITNTCEYPSEELVQQVIDEVLVDSMNLSEDSDSHLNNILPSLNDIEDIVNNEIAENAVKMSLFTSAVIEENSTIENLSNENIEKSNNLGDEIKSSSNSEQLSLTDKSDTFESLQQYEVSIENNLQSVTTVNSNIINFENKLANNVEKQQCIVNISLDKIGDMIKKLKLLKNKMNTKTHLNDNQKIEVNKEKNIRVRKGKRKIKKGRKKQLRSCIFKNDILNTAVTEESAEVDELNTAFIKIQNKKIPSRVKKNKTPRTGERRSLRNEILMHAVNNNIKLLTEEKVLQAEPIQEIRYPINNMNDKNLNILSADEALEIPGNVSLETNTTLEKFLCNELSLNDVMNKENVLSLLDIPNIEATELKSPILNSIVEDSTVIQQSLLDFSSNNKKSCVDAAVLQPSSNDIFTKELSIDIISATKTCLELNPKGENTKIVTENLQNEELSINKPIIVDMIKKSDNGIDNVFDKILIEHHNSVSVTPSNGSEIGIVLDVDNENSIISNISEPNLISSLCTMQNNGNLNNKDDKTVDIDTSFVSDNENINKYSEFNQNKIITHANEDEPIWLETKELEILEKPQLILKDKSNDLSDSDEDISLAVVAKKLSKLVNEDVVHDDAEINQTTNKPTEIDEVVCSEEDITEKPETIVTFEIIKTKKKRRYRKSILLNYKKNKPNKVESTLIPINTVETSPSKTENYCDICNKIFTRPESLSKHKMTLTHIAKLSEIEAREFFNNRKLENDDIIEAEQLDNTNLNLERVADELQTLSNKIPSQNLICIEDDSLNCKANEEELSLRHTNDKEVIDLDTSSTDSHSLIIEIDNAIAQDEYATTKSINNDNYSISIPATIDDEDEVSIVQTTDTYNPQSPKISCKNDLTDIVNRKALSVEEALFFECCSLLKSSETTKHETTGEINTFHKNIFSAVSAVTEPASSKMHLDLNQFSDISSDSNHTHQQAIPHPPPSRIYQDDSCSSNLTAFLASVDKFINAPVANQTSKNDYDSITDNHQNMKYSPISNNEQNDPKSISIFNQNPSATHFSPISSNNESKSPSFFNGNVIFNHHKSTASILNQITTNYSPISNHRDLDTPNNSSNIYSNVSISVQHEKNNHVFYSSNVGPMYNQTTSINLIEARTKNVYSEEALIVRTYSDTFSDMGDSYPSSQGASDHENYLQTIKDRLTIKDNVDDTTNRFAVVKNVLSEETHKVQSNNFTDIHDLDRTTPIPKDIEDSSNNYFASQSPVLYNSPEQSHSSSKKFLTKGALKVFESVKVSIPTAEIDLDRIIVNTNETARSKLAAFVEIALQDRENMRARSENIVETLSVECTEPLSLEVEPSITGHMKDEANRPIVEDIGGNEDCLIIDEDVCSDKDDSLMSEKCDFSEANFKVTTRIENNKNILIINKTTKSCEQNMNKVKIKDLGDDLKETKVKNAKLGNTLGFKIKKKRSATKKINKKSPKEKKVNAKFKTPKKNMTRTDKIDLASKDIYEFEDSQDVRELNFPTVSPITTSLGYLSHNVPIQAKNDVDTLISIKNIVEPVNVVLQNDDSQISSLSFSDRDDFTYISDNFSNPSDSEATQNAKLSTNKTENNPKCVIMGRIFKNAVKDKIDKPEKQNLDQLFDSLRSEKIESQTLAIDVAKQNQTLVNNNTSSANAEQSTEFTIVTEQIPKLKNTKKVQLSKDKTKNIKSTREEKQVSSDLERNLSPTKKKRKSRDKITTENETDGKPEYTEDIGVAHRKSQRKCTTGKQNVLVEFWSSDEEFDLVRKKDSKLKSEKRIGKAEKSLKMNLNFTNSKCINHMENEQPEVNKSHIPITKLMQEENMNTNFFSDTIKSDQEKQQETNFETISNIGDEDIILQDLKNLLCNEPNSEVILQEALLDTEDNIIQTNKQIYALQKATRKRRKSRRKSIRLDADLHIDIGVPNSYLTEKEILPESTKLSDIEKEAINPKEIFTENKYDDIEMEQKIISDVHKINKISVDYLSSTVLDAVDKAINIDDRTAVSENKNAPEKCVERDSIIESHITDDVILKNIADIIYKEILPQADLLDVTSVQTAKESNVNNSTLNTNESTNVDEVRDILDDTFVQGKQKEKSTVTKKWSNQSSSEFKNIIDPEVDAPKKHKRRRKRANQSLKYVESSSESDLEKESVTPRARIKKRRQTICFTELNEITDNCEDDVRHQSDIESRGVKFTNDQNKRKLKDNPSLHYSRKSENLTDESKSHHNKKQNDSKCKKPKQRRRRQDVNDDAVTAAILSEPRRKRIASEMLYYWSSSSDDDQYAGMIEVKPIRDDVVNTGEQPIQHGWIVGDSHKKLVTLLAHTKGKKTEDCVVKEGSGKRSRHTM